MNISTRIYLYAGKDVNKRINAYKRNPKYC